MNAWVRWSGIVCVAWTMLTASGGSANAANRWSSSVGEAKAVQRKTEDLAERLNRSFPYAPATQMAMQLDNSAAQLVHEVEAGAPWGQVQNSLHRTDAIAAHVASLVHADCEVRKDHRVTGYVTEIEKRVDRLRCSLEKDVARARPEICPPVVHSHSGNMHPGNVFPADMYPGNVNPRTVHPGSGYPGSAYPGNAHAEERWQGSWGPPQHNVPYGPSYGNSRSSANRPPIGRQILSAVLEEVLADH